MGNYPSARREGFSDREPTWSFFQQALQLTRPLTEGERSRMLPVLKGTISDAQKQALTAKYGDTQDGMLEYLKTLLDQPQVGGPPPQQRPQSLVGSTGGLSEFVRDMPVNMPSALPEVQQQGNIYGGLPMDVARVAEFGTSRMNPLMSMTSPITVSYTGNPSKIRETALAATNDLNIQARPNGGYYEARNYKLNTNLTPMEESEVQKAVRVCETIKTDDCSAFDNPDFAKYCIMSHVPGTNSMNEQQLGGFVLFDSAKKAQVNAIKMGAMENMQPAIGSVPNAQEGKSQYVSYDKASCIATKEAKACETQGNFSLPNCAQCFGTSKYFRVAPDAERISGSLTLAGNGSVRVIDDKGKEVGSGQLSSEAIEISLPANAEGRNFYVNVAGSDVAGYLEGPTINGRNRIDILYLISADQEAGTAKARTRGRMVVGEEPVSKIVPAQGKTKMGLVTYIPFTFLNAEESSARLCPTAPFITTEKSATRLNSDPCYNGSAPGNQSLECLQDRYVRAGCSAQGTGYPVNNSSVEQVTKLRLGPDGTPQTLFDITGRIADMATMAETGRDLSGQRLDADPSKSLENWNKLSMECLGKEVSTPCDGVPEDGPVPIECAQFLYNNKGMGKPIGPTYKSRDVSRYTSARVGDKAVRCTEQGSANPLTEDSPAYKKVMDLGGVRNIKKYYDELHARANNDSLSDLDRKEAVKMCYGIEFAADSRTSEDFTNFVPLEGPMKPTLREGYASANGNTTLNPGIGGSISYRGTGRNNFMVSQGQNERFNNTEQFRQAGTFSKVNPTCGTPGYVSLQPDGSQNLYLANVGGKVLPFDLTKAENQIVAQNNSCWREVSGQCQSPTAVRLESKAAPGQFMINRGRDIFLDAPTRPEDENGSCWEPTTNLTNKSFTPTPMPASMNDMEVRRAWNFHDDNRSWGPNPSYETNPTGAKTWEECAQRALNFVDWRGFPANGFVWAPERYMPGQNCRTKIGGYFQNYQDPNWAPLVSGKIKENQ